MSSLSFLRFLLLSLCLTKIGYPGCPFSLFFVNFLRLRLVVIERLIRERDFLLLDVCVCVCVS